MIENKRILVLAPHTDDGEFGCGGTISRLIEKGNKVFYLAFSAAEKSVIEPWPRDILKQEVLDATLILGISKENVTVLSFPVREFPLHRQDILETMVDHNKVIHPDIVFLPCPDDTHQDHQVVAQEGFRAFKTTTILGYEIPWNNLTFSSGAFVLLTEKHLNKKIEAMRCYKSQFHRGITEGMIKGLARMRGSQVKWNYAEAFEVVRWVVK